VILEGRYFVRFLLGSALNILTTLLCSTTFVFPETFITLQNDDENSGFPWKANRNPLYRYFADYTGQCFVHYKALSTLAETATVEFGDKLSPSRRIRRPATIVDSVDSALHCMWHQLSISSLDASRCVTLRILHC